MFLARTSTTGAPVFGIRSTAAHKRICQELLSAQLTHDPNEIQQVLLERPFCLEALLIFADMLRTNGDHDKAFGIIRRAVYSVECSVDAGFSPLRQAGAGCPRPCVALDLPAATDRTWPGWPWLASLFTYMIALQRQGLVRTAVEVCKLLLAMALPRDPLHLLAHVDILCLRAQQYDLLQQLSLRLLKQFCGESGVDFFRLDCILPNFAYSTAISGCLKLGTSFSLKAVNSVSVADVLPSEQRFQRADADQDPEVMAIQPHAALMCAMLLFPAVLRSLLEAVGAKLDGPPPVGSPCSETWNQVLSRRPFAESGDFRHGRHFLLHANLGDAYCRHAVPFWRSLDMQRWLHACAGRLVKMSESSLFDGELSEARCTWSKASLGLADTLVSDYATFDTSEVGPDWKPPSVILDMTFVDVQEAAALRPQRDLHMEDVESQLLRAMRLSAATEDARQRRTLVEQQDVEYRESLLHDQARVASQDSEVRTEGTDGMAALTAQLVNMGFAAEQAEQALIDAGGNIELAVSLIMEGT